ncbi:PilW family protein [Aromatoleum sp.]|uniref:PilW family protein n=1 Tax=Aromatoleum sp. TaxID=2307007 RepID=UPI002FC74503
MPTRKQASQSLPHFAAHQRGVSLVELMISMTLGLLVIGAMTTIFLNNSQSRRELDKSAQQLENGRYAIQMLRDEISLAGYFDALSSPPAGGAVTASPCSTDLAEWSASLDVVVEGMNDGKFPCIGSAKPDTGTVFVQRAATAETPAPGLAANVAYFQVSLCGEDYAGTPAPPPSPVAQFRLATPATGAFSLRQIDCAAAIAPIRRYIRRIFFIDSNNVAGDGIPTLKRADFGANQTLSAPVALVEGIEHLHFEYALDTNGDATPDEFREPDEFATAPAVKWSDVVGVRVWLIARAIESSPGYVDEKTYQLGGKDPFVPEDSVKRFKRHVFNTYIELTHPTGRRTK